MVSRTIEVVSPFNDTLGVQCALVTFFFGQRCSSLESPFAVRVHCLARPSLQWEELHKHTPLWSTLSICDALSPWPAGVAESKNRLNTSIKHATPLLHS